MKGRAETKHLLVLIMVNTGVDDDNLARVNSKHSLRQKQNSGKKKKS